MKNEIELIKLAQEGDSDAMQKILDQNKYLVMAIARKYYLIGGEKEDVIQEGMIGFFKAINTFDFNKNDNFKGYATSLIVREIISAIRRANTGNNSILNESVSFDDNLISALNHPEKYVIDEENYNEINDEIYKLLSPFESMVVKNYLKGYNYIDIATILDKDPKSIDNALSRIKSKLKHLKEKI